MLYFGVLHTIADMPKLSFYNPKYDSSDNIYTWHSDPQCYHKTGISSMEFVDEYKNFFNHPLPMLKLYIRDMLGLKPKTYHPCPRCVLPLVFPSKKEIPRTFKLTFKPTKTIELPNLEKRKRTFSHVYKNLKNINMFTNYISNLDTYYYPDNLINLNPLISRDTIIWHAKEDCCKNYSTPESRRAFDDRYKFKFTEISPNTSYFLLEENVILNKPYYCMLFPCPNCVINNLNIYDFEIHNTFIIPSIYSKTPTSMIPHGEPYKFSSKLFEGFYCVD